VAPLKPGSCHANEGGDLERRCTRKGQGSLAIADAALGVEGAKPLPASDGPVKRCRAGFPGETS
jgi:hypothetical protein